MSIREDALLLLAHLSDVHITANTSHWRLEDWFDKRMAAWVNHRLLLRSWRFRHAGPVLQALVADLDRRPGQHIVFSGDATALGFPEEFDRAASLLRPASRPGLAVPGNHDYCTGTAMRSGNFERAFAPWQIGERLDEEPYPFAQRVGGHWLVAVNSATANRLAWDARGRVGDEQLSRLGRLFEQLEGGPRVLVTHYPVGLADGGPESPYRGLRDLEGLMEVATRGGVCLWLHGHRHHPYVLQAGDCAPFPIICAGSATQEGRWSYGEYTLQPGQLTAQRRVFDPTSGTFQDGPAFSLGLPVHESPSRG